MENQTAPTSVISAIRDSGLISILRGINSRKICEVVDILGQEGVRLVEVTLDTPDALQSIQQLSRTFADDLLIGAGTVLDRETARQAIIAGARFILSPTLNPAVIECCQTNAVLPVPGVFSPAEIASARKAGAVLVKLFPVNLLGAAYIKRMSILFEDMEMLAVGGINLNNVGDFISGGAVGAGIGASLAGSDIVASRDYKSLRSRTKRYLQNIRYAKTIS